MGSVINVNGRRIELPDGARNVSIVGGRVTVGGVEVASGLSGVVEVKWQGPLGNLTCDASVSVSGEVLGDVRADGSVECGDVGRSVSAGGSVSCGDVGGDVRAGGSVSCENVSGDVKAGGSISRS